jgi:hypothetical protein
MLKQKLMETSELVSKTTELFYQNKINEGYEKLQILLEEISNRMNEIFLHKQNGNEIGIEENKLVEVLNEALAALEIKDTLLFSDIFEYELKDLFDQIIKVL